MFQLLLRRPWFRLLWAAGAISLIGDWLGFVAISRLALDQGGGPLSLAMVYAAHVLPHTWAMPVTGVVADRFDRRRLLVIVPLVQAVLTVVMAAVAVHGSLLALQVLVIVRATFAAFMPPAEAAALRHTVETNELVPANALLGGTWSVAYVLGMALGGALATLGPGTALLLDAASFVLAAFLMMGLPAMHPPSEKENRSALNFSFVKSIPSDLKLAFDHARGRADLFRAMLGKAPAAIGGGAGWILLNWVADRAQPLGTAAISLGILQAIRGAGTGIGPMCVAWVSRGKDPPRLFERLAVALSFSSIVVFTLSSSVPIVLMMVTLTWGMGAGTNWVVTAANLQRLAPESMIGRLASLDELWTTGSLVLGAFIAALLLEVGWSMTHVALACIGLGALVFVWLDQREPSIVNELAPADPSKS